MDTVYQIVRITSFLLSSASAIHFFANHPLVLSYLLSFISSLWSSLMAFIASGGLNQILAWLFALIKFILANIFNISTEVLRFIFHI